MSNILNTLAYVKIFLLDLFKTTKIEKQDFFKLSCSMLFTITILIFVNLLIYFFFPDNSEALRIEAEKLIYPLYHFYIRPESIEHLQILVSLILFPILLIFSIKVFSSKLFSSIAISDHIYFLNLILFYSILGILFYFSFKIDGSNFIATLVFFPVIAYFLFKDISKKYKKTFDFIFYSLVGIFLISLFLSSVCNRDNCIGPYDNYNAVLYSISQVQQGKILLVDFVSQYGLYSHFLYPIFKVFNINATTFSFTMSALTSLSYILIFLGLRKIIKNNLIVLLAFISIIYFGYFSFFNGDSGIYYAYKPIRMIFPALTLFSVFAYILNPNKNLYLLIIFISSLSILWNLDSGIVCFLSFYIYILYEKLIGANFKGFIIDFTKHTIISLAILGFTFFLFSILIYFQSNDFPDWSLFTKYTALFGQSYYFSLPLPLFNAWNLIFLVYIYGIYIGLNSLLIGKKDTLDKVTFFVAIFGIGIANYYMNRSHDSNLIQVLYPSFILMAIFLTKILDKNKRSSLFTIKNFSIAITISFVMAAILVQSVQPKKLINTLNNRLPDIINNKLTDQSLSNGIALVNFNASSNDQIVIISDQDSIIYLETKTSSPFSSPSSTENITQDDWDMLLNSLINNSSHKVFISGDVYKTGDKPDSRYIDILKIFNNHYYLDDWFGEWRMFLPKKYKETIQPDLDALATYSEFCPNNSINCNSSDKNFHIIENFPINEKFIKVDIELSETITIKDIMLHVIIDSNYKGTFTTKPIPNLTNIGILDNKQKKLINASERLEDIDYKVNKNLSIIIPENNYLDACPDFKIELTYNDVKKINLRVPCD